MAIAKKCTGELNTVGHSPILEISHTNLFIHEEAGTTKTLSFIQCLLCGMHILRTLSLLPT